jgi:SRSO17 transposase
MGLRAAEDTESRFVAFVDGLVSVIGHADRAGPLRDYCTGLVMPCERKSVEPMAAVTAPANVGAQHQSLLHFVGEAPSSDERVLAKVREAGNRAPWADRCVDHRRHGFSQAGAALGWRGAAILRPTRQAG